MKSIFVLVSLFLLINPAVVRAQDQGNKIITVPGEFKTIAEAVSNSGEGDWIIISPGIYFENEIEINKALTISSEWKISGDESVIERTVIDAGDKRLFMIKADGVEISGMKIINGDHTLDISANVTIIHNHFIGNLDGMSFESGGGYVAFNTAENDRDDPLDLDIKGGGDRGGSDILVEQNTFINSHDDGIEIRLFTFPDQNIRYTIRENRITGSNNAAVQLISYDLFTGKVFHIHHNIFSHCKTGLGCMEGAKTREDLGGASKMNEEVYFYNNTLVDNDMGATGGNTIIAFNNLVTGNSLGGFRLFGPNSAIYNNLFFRNGNADLDKIDPGVVRELNIFDKDPLLDRNTLFPAENSPSIDAGRFSFESEGMESVKISSEGVAGEAPDIGANEFGLLKEGDPSVVMLQVDAGEDRVIEPGESQVILAGRMRNRDCRACDCSWIQAGGPSEAKIADPDQLVTKILLDQEGIYRFLLECSDSKSTSSDYITIRYIENGNGKQLFMGGEGTLIMEADDYAYSYENVEEKRGYLLLDGGKSMDDYAQVEFSVGMAEAGEYDLWLLMKSLDTGKNKIFIEFNNKPAGEIPVLTDQKFHWVRLQGRIEASAGQWPMLVISRDGKVALERMILTVDHTMIPE